MLILPLLLEKIWMSSKLVQRADGWDRANLPKIVLLRCTWPEKPDFFTLLEMLYLPMHFSMGAFGGFHIRIKTWPRLIGSDVSYIIFPKASRVTADLSPSLTGSRIFFNNKLDFSGIKLAESYGLRYSNFKVPSKWKSKVIQVSWVFQFQTFRFISDIGGNRWAVST